MPHEENEFLGGKTNHYLNFGFSAVRECLLRVTIVS